MLAPKEEHIKALIFDESAKDGPHKVENANMTLVRLPVVKAWLAARRFMDQCDKADKNENEGIPTGTVRAIQTKWRARHNFELIGDMLLIKANQKEMYTSITQSPHQVPVILAESMRPSTALADRDLVQQLQRTESGEARFKEVVSDEVRGHFEFYKRLRAYWWTMSWLSIELGQRFTFQVALYASERVLSFVNATHGAARPPVSHYVQAWANMVTPVADIVKTNGCTLAEAIMRSAEWEHFWTFFNPGSSSAGPGRSSIPVIADNHDVKKAMMNSPEYRKMQGERDKALTQLKRRDTSIVLRPNSEAEERTGDEDRPLSPIKRAKSFRGGKGRR